MIVSHRRETGQSWRDKLAQCHQNSSASVASRQEYWEHYDETQDLWLHSSKGVILAFFFYTAAWAFVGNLGADFLHWCEIRRWIDATPPMRSPIETQGEPKA
eukprot:5961421-Amphidinium_carterae.2